MPPPPPEEFMDLSTMTPAELADPEIQAVLRGEVGPDWLPPEPVPISDRLPIVSPSSLDQLPWVHLLGMFRFSL